MANIKKEAVDVVEAVKKVKKESSELGSTVVSELQAKIAELELSVKELWNRLGG